MFNYFYYQKVLKKKFVSENFSMKHKSPTLNFTKNYLVNFGPKFFSCRSKPVESAANEGGPTTLVLN